jgi:hypothetical protein
LVNETLEQLQSGRAATDVKIDVIIGTLRNRTVNWLVSAFKEMNKPHKGSLISSIRMRYLIQAFRLCKSGTFDFSFRSITSVEALQKIREIQLTDPPRWSKIQHRPTADSISTSGEAVDESPFGDENGDDDDMGTTQSRFCSSVH